MKKSFLSLLLFVCVAFGAVVGCNTDTSTSSSTPANSSSGTIEEVDYVSYATLDQNASNVYRQEVTVSVFVDGDTTHFKPKGTVNSALNSVLGEDKLLKARYMAVNTPESTGTIEEWGKAASNFTKGKLESASSIIVETDALAWETDTTKERYLLWVWYKPNGSDTYRNLNIELLQNGFAWGSKIVGTRYADLCNNAITQAKSLSLHIYSKEQDPNFYYGTAIELDLKELRTNIDKYNGKRVAFEGIVVQYHDWNIYVEDYDEETGLNYGISVFYGYEASFHDFLAMGNKVRIVGDVTYYEAGGTYQVSNLKYNQRKPNDPDNIQKLSENNTISYPEISSEQFLATRTLEKTVLDDNALPVLDEETDEVKTEAKSYATAELMMNTSIAMKNLEVVDAYTTKNGGANDGAITFTCKAENGDTIIVRTIPLYKDGKLIQQSDYIGKTIDVSGVVDCFSGEYQIKVYALSRLVIHE